VNHTFPSPLLFLRVPQEHEKRNAIETRKHGEQLGGVFLGGGDGRQRGEERMGWQDLTEDLWGEIAVRCFVPLCRMEEIPFRRDEVATLLLQRAWRAVYPERERRPCYGERALVCMKGRIVAKGLFSTCSPSGDPTLLVLPSCSRRGSARRSAVLLFWDRSEGAILIRIGPPPFPPPLPPLFTTWKSLSSFSLSD